MASLHDKVQAVKTAVSSLSTCTSATVVDLRELLVTGSEITASKPQAAKRTAKCTTASKTKSIAANKGASTTSTKENGLSSKEKTALATHVINVTIKSLTEAAKLAPPPTPAKHDGGPLKPADRALPRRSLSTPLSPLQPRTLNRVLTSPTVTTKAPKLPTSTHSTACLASVECVRIAFTALRAIKGPLHADQTDFQLENGMSTFIGKLLALGLHDQALKELRVLKRRLDGSSPENDNAASGLAELLDYHSQISKHRLSTVTNCQVLVLKLVSAVKRPSYIESLLPVLDESHLSSPLNLLSRLAKDAEKEGAKAARLMASLSQTLLSLAPSVSSKEDTVATELRLSPSPIAAFQLQVLAFKAQLRWWKLAGHKGNADEEILSPFSRCIKCLVRRQKADLHTFYDEIAASFDNLLHLARSCGYQIGSSFDSPLASIYQILGSTAHTSRKNEDASKWYQALLILAPTDSSSSVRLHALSARLLAASLKKTKVDRNAEQLLIDVTTGLDGCLSGTATELNELLDGLSLARRSVVGLLMNLTSSMNNDDLNDLVPHLESFILRYPRFLRRWLGATPGKDASAKQVVQFDQRRQLLMQSINQTLDAALMVVKCATQKATSDWQSLDDVLQDCTALLDSLADPAASTMKQEQFGIYHIKISGLYFTQFSQLRKESNRSKQASKQMLQALNRSIDVIKSQSAVEKEKAQLSTKLELLAELCKGCGRTEDAVRTLRSICMGMAEEGVLSRVATNLDSNAPLVAWNMDERTSTLSRTLRTVAKLDKTWNDWTLLLPEAERAAILEHLIQIRMGTSADSGPLHLHDPMVAALARLYTLDKYPIRRLRFLLRILDQNIGDDHEVNEVAILANQALQQAQTNDLGQDCSLSAFVPHFEAYHTSILVLTDRGESASGTSANSSISSWTSIIDGPATKESLLAVIDDPDSLLCHLRAAGQLAGLKGKPRLQLSILELCNNITRIYAGPNASEVILCQCLLATQHITMGLFATASKILEQANETAAQSETVFSQIVVELSLSEADYFIGVGNVDEACRCLSKANAVFSDSQSTWASSKSHATLVRATTSWLESTVKFQAGDVQDALSHIKSSVRLLSNDWARLEKLTANVTIVNSDTSVADASSTAIEVTAHQKVVSGPCFWVLAYPLLRSLLHMSTVYAHVGLFQETIYYADSALKIAESTQSSFYKAQVSAWTGSVYLRAGKIDKASSIFDEARPWMPSETCSARIRFAQQLGDFYREIGDKKEAAAYSKVAEDAAYLLSHPETVTSPSVGSGNGDSQGNLKPTKVTRTARVAKARSMAAPKEPRRKVASKSKATTAPTELSATVNDVYQASLLATILLSRAAGFIRERDWTSAFSTLEQVKRLPNHLGGLPKEQIVMAASLIGQSVDEMIHHPVFSVVQDSTISFPAIASSMDRLSGDRSSFTKASSGTGTGRKASRGKDSPTFTDALKQAQELLLESHASALSRSDSGVVHKISAMLQNTLILMCATTTSKSRSSHCGFAPVAVDVARNIVWKRESKTLLQQSHPSASEAVTDREPARRRSSLETTGDLAKFQKTYIEVIPKNWSVVSISLGNNQEDLCITKLEAGHSPFILRLPLERANSRDADAEIFNFEHGRKELMDIISQANETSHSARNFSAKGERNAWWAEREALDSRLRELLETIECTWLGGFRGIFSQHQRRPDLLARFQKNFHQMLDGCLPSRTKVGGKKTSKASSISLDPRILNLFIGLGDPSEPDCDFDEALNDLLYFVVDILQFHGERNAYDEIDFDAMLIETYDALRGYHDAAKSAAREDGSHTILVLDKALHAFPWESLPCLAGAAVSRVPSLACLQQLIVDSRCSGDKGEPDSRDAVHPPQGHYVSADHGTYILNPSSDLTNTQKFFQQSFTSLQSWNGIVKKVPEESEFEKALSSSEIFLYFGHGSGAQYIRSKTIRRLPKCKPATFLMGCSSAMLSEAGEFECYGPVWNYMMAGCPAVVGTLWDVTDRDIDRFAGRAFEEWGLLPRGTFKEDKKGKGRASTRSEGDMSSENADAASASLSEAVTRARAACRFKYLNAAAVVMYGIPVYINT